MSGIPSRNNDGMMGWWSDGAKYAEIVQNRDVASCYRHTASHSEINQFISVGGGLAAGSPDSPRTHSLPPTHQLIHTYAHTHTYSGFSAKSPNIKLTVREVKQSADSLLNRR